MEDQQEKFKAGDVVRLKSGSSLMTISMVNKNMATCSCVWFSVKGKNKYATFRYEVLEHPKAI